MSIKMEPTKIKQSVYLLVPKNIADLVEIDGKTKVRLALKKSQNKNVLEYTIE